MYRDKHKHAHSILNYMKKFELLLLSLLLLFIDLKLYRAVGVIVHIHIKFCLFILRLQE